MKVVESYMRFNLDDDYSFRIEQAREHFDVQCVMVCECVVMKKDKLCLIEAKSSSPSPKSRENFDKFIGEITRKFEDSILLYNAMKMKRHGQEACAEIPFSLISANNDIRYVLYLIIHGNEIEWMPPIQDGLHNRLRHVLNAWKIKDIDVKAINHQTALEIGLIEDFFPIDELEKLEGKSSEEKRIIAEEWLMK